MMNRGRWCGLPAQLGACLTLLLACAVLAQAPATQPRPPRPKIAVKMKVTQGADAQRGGASRGGGAGHAAGPELLVLAPRVRGNMITTLEQPTLYWYLSKDTPAVVRLTISQGRGSPKDEVFRQMLPGAHKAGLHKLDLSAVADDAGRKVKLEVGKPYEFAAAVLVKTEEGKSTNPVAVIALERIAAEGSLAAGAKESDLYARAAAFAAGGAWCDALSALTAAAERDPADAEIREARNALLKDQGLVVANDGSITVEEKAANGAPDTSK